MRAARSLAAASAVLTLALMSSRLAVAQDAPPPTASRCLAVAQSAPASVQVAYIQVQDGLARPSPAEDVAIRFLGHSTFLITSPQGVTIATFSAD